MADIRIPPISRIGTAEQTWLAWTSATDRSDQQFQPDEIDADIGEAVSHRSRPSISEIDDSDILPFAKRGADLRVDTRSRVPADEFYNLNATPTMKNFGAAINTTQKDQIKRPVACRYPILDAACEDDSADFEPVDDLPFLPPLGFKPLILRKWTLIIVGAFYLGLIAGIGVLYWFENNARIFHIRATASHLTIRILPSVIGSISTIIFQSVAGNFARISPYIAMANPGSHRASRASGSRTILAQYFPFLTLGQAFGNRHYELVILTVVNVYLAALVTPLKATLIHRKAAEDDPSLWTISISAGASKALIFIYLVFFICTLFMSVKLWNQRTGLKWDPVSIADQLTLLQGSNVLDDFCGLEYYHQPTLKRWFKKSTQFQHMEREDYRIGYWIHKPTKQYWHGLRKWPLPTVGTPDDPYPGNIHDAPSLIDSSQARAWWAEKYSQVQQNPERCYAGLYMLISDIPAIVTYLVVVAVAGGGVYAILTDRLKTGFTYSLANFQRTNFLLNFVPAFVLQLLGGYWYQIDLWYRQLQPFMGLRHPSPATENLLLGYTCDLPVVITLKALANKHWRLSFTSVMPLVQRVIPILAGSVLSIVNTSDTEFHIGIAALPFKAVMGILLSYLILIPVAWPGLNRRLPIRPMCIADPLVLFYDSTLIRKDAFLPRSLHEQRWHMEYRLCLEERLYGFGVYRGRYGAIHIGIDDVYGHSSDEMGFRFVAPLKPPRRWYRRWLTSAWKWTSQKMKIKRQSTLKPEEFEAQQRLHVELQEMKKAVSEEDQNGETEPISQNKDQDSHLLTVNRSNEQVARNL